LVARVRVRERERVAAAARDRQVVVDRDRAPRAVLVYKATTVCRAAVTRRCEGDRSVCGTSTLCAPRSLRPWRVLYVQPRSSPPNQRWGFSSRWCHALIVVSTL
jgi:hypothetical protein